MKKLDASQLKLIWDVTEGDQDMYLDPQGPRVVYRRYIFDLLGHVAALEAEHTATMQQVVKDAYTNGAAVGKFIKEQTDRIEALEAELEQERQQREMRHQAWLEELELRQALEAKLGRIQEGVKSLKDVLNPADKANG